MIWLKIWRNDRQSNHYPKVHAFGRPPENTVCKKSDIE
jgi:hypothetical protein